MPGMFISINIYCSIHLFNFRHILYPDADHKRDNRNKITMDKKEQRTMVKRDKSLMDKRDKIIMDKRDQRTMVKRDKSIMDKLMMDKRDKIMTDKRDQRTMDKRDQLMIKAMLV